MSKTSRYARIYEVVPGDNEAYEYVYDRQTRLLLYALYLPSEERTPILEQWRNYSPEAWGYLSKMDGFSRKRCAFRKFLLENKMERLNIPCQL